MSELDRLTFRSRIRFLNRPLQRDVMCLRVLGHLEDRTLIGEQMLRDDINNSLKDAMKAGDARRVSTLRLVNASLKNADIEARGQGRPALSDDDVLGVLQKMIKQRHESAELYEKGGRADLVTQEREEIAIIEKYLPKQMTD